MSEVDKLHDALERQRELIAALRAEVATKDKRIALLADKLQAGAYHDKDTALIMEQQAQRIADLEAGIVTMSGEAAHTISGLTKRVAELEAAQADGRTYSEGCVP